MAGVAALVVALAINSGFREELEKRLLGATANINLLKTSKDGITHYDELAARLERYGRSAGRGNQSGRRRLAKGR